MLRFALPPTLPAGVDGVEALLGHSRLLREVLSARAGVTVDVIVARDYDAIRQALVTGAVDAALAPPVVCAQVAAAPPPSARVPVPLQTIRMGHAAFASALLARSDRPVVVAPRTLRAAWVDPLSVAGHLLPKAWLRQQRHRVDGFFVDERFHGTYRAALQAVLDGDADVCGVHTLPGGQALDASIAAHLPSAVGHLQALAITAAVPGDGVAVAPRAAVLVDVLLALPADLVATVFRADGFARAADDAFAALAAVTSEP